MRTVLFTLSFCLLHSFAVAMDNNTVKLVFFGPAGSGKSTLINTFSNLASQKKWHDYPKDLLIATDFQASNVAPYIERRVEGHARGQLGAVTQEPSEYIVAGEGYTLHLIDTPGSCDPKGIEQDRKNLVAIAQFLAGHNEINAFCIVMKSSVNRMTIEERYAYEQIKYIIPQGAKDRIFIIATHDGTDHENLKAFARALALPVDHIFHFDNFALTREGHRDFSRVDIAKARENEAFADPFAPIEIERDGAEQIARAKKAQRTWRKSQMEFTKLLKEARALGASELAPAIKEIWSLKKSICEHLVQCFEVAALIEKLQPDFEASRREYERAALEAQWAKDALNAADRDNRTAFNSLEEAIFAYREVDRDFARRAVIQQVIDVRRQASDAAFEIYATKIDEEQAKQATAASKSNAYNALASEVAHLQNRGVQLHLGLITYFQNLARITMSNLSDNVIHYYDVSIRKEHNQYHRGKLYRERAVYVALYELHMRQ